jgi:SAM-dependent methyltransferase
VAFADHFSSSAESYAAFRPSYPAELIDYLADLAPANDLAWDVGTGNGQAARLLAARFSQVVASDASRDQIAHAVSHPRVTYRVGLEDESGLPAASADLVTVAQALHWFDLERFYKEAERVLKPGGVLAAWTYGLLTIDAEVDPVLAWFYGERVGRYWPPERRHVDRGYRDLPFPFAELPAERWVLRSRLTRADLVGFAGTWSAVKECRAHEGTDPIPLLAAALAAVWPRAGESREATWPIALRVGRRGITR